MPQPENSCRLLVVDDHDDTRELLARLLARCSYEVTTARCFETAMARAAEATPHVVISDIGLPGRDGMELMRELTQRCQGVRGIAISGHPLDDGMLREAGFVAHLLKPIQFEELLAMINQTCARCAATATSGDDAPTDRADRADPLSPLS